jgi:hypothetical protein
VGRISDPRRASDAWLLSRPVDGLEIHGALPESAVANLEDLSEKCVVPTLTFDLLFAFLVLGHGRRQLLWCEVTRASDRRVVGPADHRGFPLGISAGLSDPRQ